MKRATLTLNGRERSGPGVADITRSRRRMYYHMTRRYTLVWHVSSGRVVGTRFQASLNAI